MSTNVFGKGCSLAEGVLRSLVGLWDSWNLKQASWGRMCCWQFGCWGKNSDLGQVWRGHGERLGCTGLEILTKPSGANTGLLGTANSYKGSVLGTSRSCHCFLLAPSLQDLQYTVGRFAAYWEVTGMRISSSKSKDMVLDRQKVACRLQVGGQFLLQVEELKFLGVLFVSEGRMEWEIHRWIDVAAAIMWTLL